MCLLPQLPVPLAQPRLIPLSPLPPSVHTTVLLVGLKQTSAQRGASVLLAGLVPSARGVFRVMGEWQLEEGAGTPGISFPQLFRLVRPPEATLSPCLLQCPATQANICLFDTHTKSAWLWVPVECGKEGNREHGRLQAQQR